MERIVVVGANHAGTHAIIKLCENRTDQEIEVYDRNDNISFLGCGMALWVGNVIDNSDCLFYANSDMLSSMGCNIHLRSDVIGVDYVNKNITVKDLVTNEVYTTDFDKLIIACGSWPTVPPIKGVSLENVEILKIFQHAELIINKIRNENINKVVVIGGGYIGIEIAEALATNKKEVVLINDKKLLSGYYDEIYQEAMKNKLLDLGIDVREEALVSEIYGNSKVEGVKIGDESIETDMVILATGFKPITDTFKSDLIEMEKNGAIVVNEKMQSSLDYVYAVGDCASIYDSATDTHKNIALASNALKTGIVAGLNAIGIETIMPSVQGSNAIYINHLVLASTGIRQSEAKNYNIDADCVTITDTLKPSFMPDNHDVTVTLTYEKITNRVIGFQIMSTYDVSLIVHMFSLAIEKHCTVHDIYLMDTFFLPHFNQPRNFIMRVAEESLLKIAHENVTN